MKRLIIAAAAALWASAAAAASYPVGERHLTTTEPSAALRDAQHRDTLRITVWYPAAASAQEQDITIGPPGQPLFYVGESAPDAAFADDRRRPVILFSHGFGGTARIMGWFGTAMASQGYVVVAVDHPGNNGVDAMTIAGATLFWERPGDLAAALAKVKADPGLFRHLDLSRVGVAGLSAGGFASLAAVGARVDLGRFEAFCRAHPTDGVCAPQKEFAVSMDQALAFLASPEAAPSVAHAGDDHTIPEVRAAFAMAPAIVQALDPKSLHDLRTPVAIILGDSDPVAPPNTNGGAAARAIPGARLKVLPGVGHYDFLAQCTPAGDAVVKTLCPVKVPRRETHHAAVEQALIFFAQVMGPPP
jgi:predicted dienelactone hydrolase